MGVAEEFIEGVLQHDYDPVKRRQYYLRTRKLKGRRKGRRNLGRDPRPRGRLYEDQLPEKSPRGGKLVDFSNGRATYSDGQVFSSKGWTTSSSTSVRRARLNNVKSRIDNTRKLVNKMPNGPQKRAAQESLRRAEASYRKAQSIGGRRRGSTA